KQRTMYKAIIIQQHGEPEVMEYSDFELAAPAAREVTVQHTAIGVNYIDVYARNGSYPLITPPGTPGMEAVGVVRDIGNDVHGLSVGQRVAYVLPAAGAYCEARNIHADRLVPMPDDIDDQTAAALMLKGMTAERLLSKTTRPVHGS